MHSAISSKSPSRRRSSAAAPAAPRASRLAGHSAAVGRLEDAIARVGHLDCPVLLTGETGAGKDEAARAIHAAGSRATRPLVAINCAGIVGTLAESLLFGHEQGSFTGADSATLGAFRAADRGILFLDEIGELPLDLQPKLLRVLELREVVPVGATKPVKVDVQVIAATNRNLRHEVTAGRFRQDLLYRLNTIHLTVPPLRDRRDDIPLFAARFAAECAERFDRPGWSLPDEAIRRFMDHSWPGNVRELKQTILRIAIFEDRLAEILDEMDFTPPEGPEGLAGSPEQSPTEEPAAATSEAFNLDELRRDAVCRALVATDGHYGRAAALLGVSAKTMTKLAAEARPGAVAKRGRRPRNSLPR
jgi:transcriptional regulator with GAF, ATPase, and Fis domain